MLHDIGMDAIIQLAASTALVGLVIAATWHLGIGREGTVAGVRALVQVLLMGLVLTGLLSLSPFWALPLLVAMAAVAASISNKRSTRNQFALAFVSILGGAGIALLAMLLMGAIAPDVRGIVPVGSILLATAMRTVSLVFERAEREADNPQGRETTVRAALIPAVDGMKSLGLVWIPGVMTGLVLGGASPVRAAVLQFVVVALGFVAAAIAAMLASRRA